MNPEHFSRVVHNVLREAEVEAETKALCWPFKGYQQGKVKGIKRELKEFAGNPKELIQLIDDFDVLLVHVAPVTYEVMQAARKLKIIGCARGGPVNVDIDAATELGIPVLYVPARNAIAVAEHTIGLILSISRNIARAHYRLKSGIWEDEFYDFDKCGFELRGKTIGLIGLGSVGIEVARLATAFGMRVISFDPYVDEDTMKSYGVEKVSLETLLKESDIISIHARLSTETKNLIGEREFAKVKKGAILINTARGEIVDEEALIKAIKDGQISSAGLDVFYSEPLTPHHPLIKLEQVILTPHIAGASKETVYRAAKILAEDVVRIIRGEAPRFCANPQVLTKR